MNRNRAAIRYAKAVMDFAMAQKAEKALQQDFDLLLEQLASSSELADFLSNPVLDSQKKVAALQAIFPKTSQAFQKTLALLADNQRIELLPQVASEYLDQYDMLQGIQKVKVTTAAPLSANLEKEVMAVAQKMTDQKVVLQNEINPEIIGGFILQLGDHQYDASVAQQLQRIKQELIEN